MGRRARGKSPNEPKKGKRNYLAIDKCKLGGYTFKLVDRKETREALSDDVPTKGEERYIELGNQAESGNRRSTKRT